jgi:hypothetical protein
MKKKYIVLLGTFFLFTGVVNAGGLFGASLKPNPNITLFGQTITWPIPSLCVGAKAGVLPDASVSSDGLNFKVPYLAIQLPFPSLTMKAGASTVEVKLGAVEKIKSE